MKAAITTIVVFAILLVGCASDKTKPSQGNLVASTATSRITLKEELVINTFKDGENGLMPGAYVPVAESAEGVFFDGPKDCIWERIGSKRSALDGGIWWPKDKDKKPRMYWRLSEKHLPKPGPDGRLPYGGSLLYWIIKSGLGDASFFPEISDQRILNTITPVEPSAG